MQIIASNTIVRDRAYYWPGQPLEVPTEEGERLVSLGVATRAASVGDPPPEAPAGPPITGPAEPPEEASPELEPEPDQHSEGLEGDEPEDEPVTVEDATDEEIADHLGELGVEFSVRAMKDKLDELGVKFKAKDTRRTLAARVIEAMESEQ